MVMPSYLRAEPQPLRQGEGVGLCQRLAAKLCSSVWEKGEDATILKMPDREIRHYTKALSKATPPHAICFVHSTLTLHIL